MVVTRFAPSPTGDLHLGSVRTALFAWLFARHHQGQCLLRIEDTDLNRSSQASVEVILQGLQWLGLDFDGEIVYQTQRSARYQQIIDALFEKNMAYVCECTQERLTSLRESQLENKQKPKYDRACINKGLEWAPGRVIRFKQPTEGSTLVEDVVFGTIEVKNEELDDLVLARADGSPTYNLCVVIDDWDSGVTHVVRGDDHINNTPRQINILKALGAPVPTYAHLPTILGTDGKKLSKRHGAVSILQFKEEGYLPEAMLNMLVRLGWSYKDEELFTKEQMIERFTLEGVNRSPAAFDPKKLTWLNQHYLRSIPLERISEALLPLMESAGVNVSAGPSLDSVIEIQRDRAKTLIEMKDKSLCFYQQCDSYDEKEVAKHLNQDSLPILQHMENIFVDCSWDKTVIHDHIIEATERFSVGYGKVGQPLRVALTGHTNAPGIEDTLVIFGRTSALKQIRQAIEYIEKLV
ncbi:MAG: glutamate--tRNA ligase [Legionellales bacterium]|nr:glutamate--tRNA ligase [Legionellales bacterium]